MNKESLRLARYNEDLYADGHYSKHLSTRILYTEGYYTECLYAWFHYAEGHYAEDHYAEGHFVVCHYPEYHYPSFEFSKAGNTGRRGRLNTTDNLIRGGHIINLLTSRIKQALY
jgi:hypothetical protein